MLRINLPCKRTALNLCIGVLASLSLFAAEASAAWRTFTVHPVPIWEGSNDTASDPTVIKDGSTYRLYHTCYASQAGDAHGVTSGICQAVSADGFNWSWGPSIDAYFSGVVFKRPNGGWDDNIETAEVVKLGAGSYGMWFSGYRDPGNYANGNRPPAPIGFVSATTPTNFTVNSPSIVLSPVGGSNSDKDGDDLFSPTLFTHGGQTRMIYTGWCIDGFHDNAPCKTASSADDRIWLLGATQDPVTNAWTKHANVVLQQSGSTWMRDGIAEPDVLVGPDGKPYLFFTAIQGAARRIGLAYTNGAGPDGAFTSYVVNPSAIISSSGAQFSFNSCGVLAPTTLYEPPSNGYPNGSVKVWFLATDDCQGACPSCDHDACKCTPKHSIGYAEAAWPLVY